MELPTPFDPFAGPAVAQVITMTDAQEEIWHSCLFGGDDANRAYNESLSLRFTGNLDSAAMERTLQEVVRRHESLRSVISPDGSFMCIYGDRVPKIEYHDLSHIPETEKYQKTKDFIRQDARFVFDLIEGPLFKAGLLKLSDETHHLVLTAHHIVCDGWSLGILLQELGTLYSADVGQTQPALPEAVPYSAFAEYRHRLKKNGSYTAIENFWLGEFAEGIPEVQLPTDNPRPELRTYKSGRLDFNVDPILLKQLKEVGFKANCSFVTVLIAVFELYLSRLTGKDQLVVGLPAAGQSAMGADHLVGHCVNLLPLKSSIPAKGSFVDYLQRRKSALMDAYEHQELTFGHLLKKLAMARDTSKIPLVPVVFNVDLGLDDGVFFENLTYELHSNPRAYETFELFLNASGSSEALMLEWSYNTALFHEDSIRGMMADFETTARELVAAPDSELAQCIFEDHRAEYTQLNATARDFESLKGTSNHFPTSNLPSGNIKSGNTPSVKSTSGNSTSCTVPELFRRQAQETPTATALEFGKTSVSYRKLVEDVNRWSHYFTEKGIGLGDMVGLALPRNEHLPAVMLALQQSGIVYVPLDPEYPRLRLEHMLEDSGAKKLLVTKALSANFPKVDTTLYMEEAYRDLGDYPVIPPSVTVAPETNAYLLYTSGSTGKPKGVPITHGSLVNLLLSLANEPGIEASDTMLAITTISFDISNVELFLPLISGATVVMADTATAKDGRLLLEKLVDANISILQATPSTYRMLLNAGWQEKLLLKAFIGGEALPLELARQLLTRCESLWNMYGPTETTVYSLIKKVSASDDPITIGRPIANTQVYILTEQGRLAPPGVIGQIAIGGAGVAKGYWQRPELSSEKFRTNPFDEQGSPMYMTGDLGKLLPDGNIQCLGRSDRQIKVRGHRIEPGEVEYALSNLPGVTEAAMTLQNDRLTAYLVPSDLEADHNGRIPVLKKALQAVLPSIMVPHEFLFLDVLPVTPNGKLDRQRLIESGTSQVSKKVYHQPRSEAESQVAAIWQECMGLDKIDIQDDFFELGGHSLIAVQVMTRLEKETGKRFPLSVLFQNSTIEKMARLINGNDRGKDWDSLVPIKPEGGKLPFYIVHGAGLNVLNFNPLAKFMDADQPVYALQPKGLNGIDEPLTSVEAIAAYYNKIVVESQPRGPYALGGYSYGGIIAYEMARQLLADGKQVTTLAIFDTYVFPAYLYDTESGKKWATAKYFLSQKVHTFKLMFGSIQGLKLKIEDFSKKAERLFARIKNGKSEANVPAYDALIEANERAMEAYTIKPIPIKIDLFRVEQQLVYVHDSLYLGWKPFALEGVEVHDIPGDHERIFSPPNDRKSAKILQQVLDKNHEGL